MTERFSVFNSVHFWILERLRIQPACSVLESGWWMLEYRRGYAFWGVSPLCSLTGAICEVAPGYFMGIPSASFSRREIACGPALLLNSQFIQTYEHATSHRQQRTYWFGSGAAF